MNKIENYNCDGLCANKWCDKKYTHFTEKIINGMTIHLAFCEKHSIEFEEGE